MHDQTADREEEGMSDGRGRRRRKHTHPFFMPFAAAETGGKKTRRTERHLQGQMEGLSFSGFHLSIYLFFISCWPQLLLQGSSANQSPITPTA